MNFCHSIIYGLLLIFLVSSCKSDSSIAKPVAPSSKIEVSVSGDKKPLTVENLGKTLNMSPEQIKSVTHIERKFNREHKKMLKENQWAGPKNRPNRAAFAKSKKKALNRILGPELAKEYDKRMTASKK